MSSASELDNYLRVARTMVDALKKPLNEVLDQIQVPQELRQALVARWEEEHQVDVISPAVLTGELHRRELWRGFDPASGYYWPRLRRYLLDVKGWTKDAVDSVDGASDKVLHELGYPGLSNPEERFRVQGLVVGYVQSGKTANYSALLAKAADAGYRLFIVLSGIHNILRRQGQRRLEPELGACEVEGFEPLVPDKKWVTLTGRELNEDFRTGTINNAILGGSLPMLAVVKKHGTVLRRLLNWLPKLPPTFPVLVIDDEADQASINTSDEETQPSVINSRIRELLNKVHRVTYVGYTATPFANVFINHETNDEKWAEDLYPRDFIIALEKPPTYVGNEALFGRPALDSAEEIPPLPVIEIVPEQELVEILPESVSDPDFNPSLPTSLRNAVLDYLLAAAGSITRRGDRAATMLVHTHHTIDAQKKLAEIIGSHLSNLRQDWRYDKDNARPLFERRWQESFIPRTAQFDQKRVVPFSAIEPQLDSLLKNKEGLTVRVINSDSEDELDFEREPTMKAILVGGNRLSRGLTIEELLVSYFVRETPYYDTLLQMGRWFGYRRDYVDLTRIYTTNALFSWFRDIAAAEEELREDIRLYAVTGKRPVDFGPRVRTHEAMSPTAPNKLGGAQQARSSFAASLRQTIVFDVDNPDVLRSNIVATRQFAHRLGKPSADADWVGWRNVPAEEVIRFLCDYRASAKDSRFNLPLITDYIRQQQAYSELRHWDVAIRGNKVASSELGMISFGPGLEANNINRSRYKGTSSIGVLINPSVRGEEGGDERVGMSAEELSEAERLAELDSSLKFGRALRRARSRDRGLLLIYPISPNSSPAEGRTNQRRERTRLFESGVPADLDAVVGVALVFPDSETFATTGYLVGSAGARTGQ